MGVTRDALLYVLALVLLGLGPVSAAESSSSPVLIKNVRPWGKVGAQVDGVDLLVANGVIDKVSQESLAAPPEAIIVDGEDRVVIGRIAVGQPANLLVIEGDPGEDITALTEPSSMFLVMENGVIQESAISSEREAGTDESKYRAVDPVRFKVVTLPEKPWYVYETKRFNIGFGGAILLDRTEFDQDQGSMDQLGSLEEFDSAEVRAARFGVGGSFRLFDKPWAYSLVGANRAFDQGFNTGTSEEWVWYDWAIGIPVYGDALLKIGKQKETISHDRLTVLVDQQFMERAAFLDAMLPSRNTGVTLANNALDGRMAWSTGIFFDMFGDRDAPFEESKQYIARISGLPIATTGDERIVHVGAGYRYSDAGSGVVRYRSSPEVFFSPDFVDTGDIATSSSSLWLLEGGWKEGPFWLMSEFSLNDVSSRSAGDPDFSGFHVTGAWAITGERRDYDKRQGIFTKLKPARDVSSGGAGAWEVVARYSDVDLTDGLVEGGDMSRISLGVNWYATQHFKGTAQYGWIDLDRFGIPSTTRVFQIRMAFLLGL